MTLDNCSGGEAKTLGNDSANFEVSVFLPFASQLLGVFLARSVAVLVAGGGCKGEGVAGEGGMLVSLSRLGHKQRTRTLYGYALGPESAPRGGDWA